MTWKISSKTLEPDQLLVEESLHSLANGYLGVRGNFEEGYRKSMKSIRGTYINAFYDEVEIPYGEKHHGFPTSQQKILNIIDSQSIEIFIGEEEERFSLFEGEILSYDRTLHLDKGFSERNIHWRSPMNREIKIQFRRIVSFVNRELFSIQVLIEPVNFFGQVKIVSTVNGDVTNFVDESDPRVGSGNEKLLKTIETNLNDGVSVVVNETTTSKLRTACITSYVYSRGQRTESVQDKHIETVLIDKLEEPLVFEKRNVYVDTRRQGENLTDKGIEILNSLKEVTFEQLVQEQEGYLQNFWSKADVIIHGDQQLQQGIRFNLFHLLQSAGRDAYSSIAAKGLSGEGYEGYYFWDTEIYMMPVFIMTKPELAKQLLLYRYTILDHARMRAKEMGHKKGALNIDAWVEKLELEIF